MTVENKTRLQFKMQKLQYTAFLLTPEMPYTKTQHWQHCCRRRDIGDSNQIQFQHFLSSFQTFTLNIIKG